jgi:hypothetical protein
MKQWRGDLEFLSKIFLGMFCLWSGSVKALPQDWSCDGFEVQKISEKAENSDMDVFVYEGEENGFKINLKLLSSREFPHTLLDCGTGGCAGMITNTKTGKTEAVRLDCSDVGTVEFQKLKCSLIMGDEYFLEPAEDDVYRANLCAGKSAVYLHLRECDKCVCVVYHEDKTTRKMNCTKEKDGVRCFTYHGYENWRKFENEWTDFDRCVGLKM